MAYANWSAEQLQQVADAYDNGIDLPNLTHSTEQSRLFGALVEAGMSFAHPEDIEIPAVRYYNKSRQFAAMWEDEIESICDPWACMPTDGSIDSLYQVYAHYATCAAEWASRVMMDWLADHDPSDVLTSNGKPVQYLTDNLLYWPVAGKSHDSQYDISRLVWQYPGARWALRYDNEVPDCYTGTAGCHVISTDVDGQRASYAIDTDSGMPQDTGVIKAALRLAGLDII